MGRGSGDSGTQVLGSPLAQRPGWLQLLAASKAAAVWVRESPAAWQLEPCPEVIQAGPPADLLPRGSQGAGPG